MGETFHCISFGSFGFSCVDALPIKKISEENKNSKQV